jgi:hypothetical protein
MPVRGGLRWDDDELQRKLDALGAEWPQHRSAVLDALAEDVAGGLRREIPTSSGAAKQTIRTRGTGRDDNEAEVLAGGMRGVNYVESILHGSRPHAPGSSNPAENTSLARWARRNNYPGGFESIYWSIYHHGTSANDFVSEPVAETQARADDIAERVLRQRGVFDR